MTTTTAYVYDGEDILLAVETSDATGTPITTTTRYVHGPGIDEPWLVETGGHVFAVHADGLGSVTGLSDASQTLVEARAYSPFGQIQRSGSAPNLAYAYTGREWEPNLGLYYYRTRYYDPEAGRFLSPDPTGFAGGDSNPYAYVAGDPVNYVDLLGTARAKPRPKPRPGGSPPTAPPSPPDTDNTTGEVRPPVPPPPPAPKPPGTGCYAVFETCMRGADRCPRGVRQVVAAICVAVWLTCEVLQN